MIEQKICENESGDEDLDSFSFVMFQFNVGWIQIIQLVLPKYRVILYKKRERMTGKEGQPLLLSFIETD